MVCVRLRVCECLCVESCAYVYPLSLGLGSVTLVSYNITGLSYSVTGQLQCHLSVTVSLVSYSDTGQLQCIWSVTESLVS